MSEIVRTETSAGLATLAEQINAEHRACEAALKSGLEHALKAGELLIEAKSQTKHGEWGRWVGENFEGSVRTAQAYMKVARQLPNLEAQKRNGVADLSFRDALRELAAPPKARGLAYMADEVDKLLRQTDALPRSELQMRLTEGLRDVTRDILKMVKLDCDKATTPQEYKALGDVCLTLQNAWAESVIDAEREMGRLLAEMEAEERA